MDGCKTQLPIPFNLILFTLRILFTKANSMKIRLLLLTALLWASPLSTRAEAGCWCNDLGGWTYCFDDWTSNPGVTTTVPVITYSYGVEASDTKNIDSCPYSGATPPTKICDAQGGLVNVKNAEVTGNVDPTYFGFTGTVNQTITVDLKCGGTVTINS